MKLLAKIRKRVVKEKKQLIKRSLEAPGKILVKPGEKVEASDVIAEGVITAGFRSLPLAEILKVKAKDGSNYLLKKVGERVYPGEIIAKRKSLFGLSRRVLTSPIEGTIAGYDSEGGILRLEFLPQVQRLVAGCNGEVADIPDRKTVIISCVACEIFGVLGSGRTREGVLKVLAKKDEFLLPSVIDETCSGAIIVGGALVSRAALSKAMAVGVAGIIAGGIHARDFFEIGGATMSPFWTSSDVGLTLILTEGFGHRVMSEDIFSCLVENKNKFVLIDGDRAAVTIPQLSVLDKTFSSQEDERSKELVEREIKIGDRVRIIDYDQLGIEGTVKSISRKVQAVPSGLMTYTVEIETNKGRIEIPYQNIEILV